jgi:hypothetical protein
MSKKILSITRLRSGGLITNYHCSSSCRHCLYRCSPKWPKEYISPETIRENLRTIKVLGCHSIHVGGGEPLLNPSCVASVLEIAGEERVFVEYVETNSSWYQNHDDACTILAELADRGLSTLLVSISPFHNEHIPFYKIKGVMEACYVTGISIFPWIAAFIPDISVFDETTTHALEEYQAYFGDHYLENLPRRYWISPGGRALETFGELPQKKSLSKLQSERSECMELADVSHFHIDLYGNYIPGSCSGLSVRREDLGTVLDQHEYPIISRLYSRGIGGFVSYAKKQYGFSASRTEYASKCALCHEIRRFLVIDKGVTSKELQPVGHYMYG